MHPGFVATQFCGGDNASKMGAKDVVPSVKGVIEAGVCVDYVVHVDATIRLLTHRIASVAFCKSRPRCFAFTRTVE